MTLQVGTAVASNKCPVRARATNGHHDSTGVLPKPSKPSKPNASQVAVRDLAVSSLAGILLAAQPAFALYPGNSLGDRWDGESAAIGSCKLGEAGDECRANVLAKDKLLNYGQVSNSSSGKISGSATGVPVSNLDSKYARETTALAETLKNYMNLDPSDDTVDRQSIVKTVKKESLDWQSPPGRCTWSWTPSRVMWPRMGSPRSHAIRPPSSPEKSMRPCCSCPKAGDSSTFLPPQCKRKRPFILFKASRSFLPVNAAREHLPGLCRTRSASFLSLAESVCSSRLALDSPTVSSGHCAEEDPAPWYVPLPWDGSGCKRESLFPIITT
jgi:hypothetical protein